MPYDWTEVITDQEKISVGILPTLSLGDNTLKKKM